MAKNVTNNGKIARLRKRANRLFQCFEADKISDMLRRTIRQVTAATLISDATIDVNLFIVDNSLRAGAVTGGNLLMARVLDVDNSLSARELNDDNSFKAEELDAGNSLVIIVINVVNLPMAEETVVDNALRFDMIIADMSSIEVLSVSNGIFNLP